MLLLEQDRKKWDALLVRRGLDALDRAESLLQDRPGPYVLQAAIAACHARAAVASATDWARLAALYDALAQRAPSPIVELNRAVAHGLAFGPEWASGSSTVARAVAARVHVSAERARGLAG